MQKRIPYDKNAVLTDLTEKILIPAEIADKYGITVMNVYKIRSEARKAGIINSRGEHSIGERIKQESSVFTPELRERIKDMREEALTSTEINAILLSEGIESCLEDVYRVMSRGIM